MAQPAVELFDVVPVGAIIAWYPPPNATIPPNFAYCDGSTVNDKDSPFYNSATPNLSKSLPAWHRQRRRARPDRRQFQLHRQWIVG